MKSEKKIRHISISKIRNNPENPRFVKRHRLKSLCKSIEESPELFEARPILVEPENDHFIILCGNMRFEAAKKLKMEFVPVIVMRGITAEQKRAIIVKDNGTWGSWDFDLLCSKWADMPLRDWGIIVPKKWLLKKPEIIEDEPQNSRARVLRAQWGTAFGQIWNLGPHRVMCGVSTTSRDTDALLNGLKPNLTVTDLPDGVEYDDFAWSDVWSLFPGNIAYVWHPVNRIYIVANSLVTCGFDLRAQIILKKNLFATGPDHYHSQHMPCWYAVRRGKDENWRGDRHQTTVWTIPQNQKSRNEHSTQKPVLSTYRPIINSSSEGEAVYDPFLGSGSTLMACEQTNRVCYGIEVDPAYVAVTLQRWKDATGKTPILA